MRNSWPSLPSSCYRGGNEDSRKERYSARAGRERRRPASWARRSPPHRCVWEEKAGSGFHRAVGSRTSIAESVLCQIWQTDVTTLLTIPRGGRACRKLGSAQELSCSVLRMIIGNISAKLWNKEEKHDFELAVRVR